VLCLMLRGLRDVDSKPRTPFPDAERP
jgi:hypothetical protein